MHKDQNMQTVIKNQSVMDSDCTSNEPLKP